MTLSLKSQHCQEIGRGRQAAFDSLAGLFLNGPPSFPSLVVAYFA
jgi:hypothetical protein